MKNKKGTRMKKVLALFLSLSLLSFNQPICTNNRPKGYEMHTNKNSLLGTGCVVALCAAFFTKSAKKNGDKKKQLIGTLLTFVGIALILGGLSRK